MTVCGLITKLTHRLIYLFCLGKWGGVLEAQELPAWKFSECKSFVGPGVMKKYSPHFHPLIFALLNKNESFCSKHAQKRLNVAITLLLLRIVQISKSHVQGVQNFCFSSFLPLSPWLLVFLIIVLWSCPGPYSQLLPFQKTCAYISF